jgi:hypothetical protein
MAQRLRVGNQGVPALDMNHSSMNKPEFGIGVGANGVTRDMMDWQGEPLDPNDPRGVYAFNFMPNVNEKAWRKGTPLFTIRTPGTIMQPALDISQVQELAWEAAQEAVEERHSKGTRGDGDDRRSALKRSIDSEAQSTFTSMEAVREMLDYSGVLFRAPGPYMRTGRRNDEFTLFAGGPKTAPLQIFGGTDHPNMWDNYPRTITPGQCCWLIIKPIPLSDMMECKSSTGEIRRMTNITPRPTDMVIALIWYTSQDNKPPARAQNLGELMDNPTKQPPLYSRSYKKFRVDTNGEVSEKFFDIEDGEVFLIGFAQHAVTPLVTSNDQRTKLQTFSIEEINRKGKIFLYLPRPGYNNIPYV